jgi:hypothetical protein
MIHTLHFAVIHALHLAMIHCLHLPVFRALPRFGGYRQDNTSG